MLVLVAILIGIPLAIFNYEASRKGQTLGQYFQRTLSKIRHKQGSLSDQTVTGAKHGKKIDFLRKKMIGDPVGDIKPWITHLKIVDLDKDGLLDVVACDAKLNQIRWIRQYPKGIYKEKGIGSEIRGPAHVSPCDIDKDGDLDLLVGKMGIIFPENDKIGAVIVLENDGNQNFTNRVLLDNVARVCDVRAGDFDNDGDLDLIVAQFGYDDGEIRWMENQGNWKFKSHIIQSLSGAIHVIPDDFDQDGDLDIVALVSQEWEEIYIFKNDGKANFTTNLIYGSTNEDFGSSGISLIDLDKDGDKDILYTNGDAFDYIPPQPRPWHGVQWIENEGGMKFTYHRIGDFPGAYFANGVDVDHDGDFDVFVVSDFNIWEESGAQSFAWFENDGQMNFVYHDIASSPTHLLVLDSADMDGDGWMDFVSGAMHAYPPYDRMSRVVLWLNNWPDRKIIK